jgi:hypothetical protein
LIGNLSTLPLASIDTNEDDLGAAVGSDVAASGRVPLPPGLSAALALALPGAGLTATRPGHA